MDYGNIDAFTPPPDDDLVEELEHLVDDMDLSEIRERPWNTMQPRGAFDDRVQEQNSLGMHQGRSDDFFDRVVTVASRMGKIMALVIGFSALYQNSFERCTNPPRGIRVTNDHELKPKKEVLYFKVKKKLDKEFKSDYPLGRYGCDSQYRQLPPAPDKRSRGERCKGRLQTQQNRPTVERKLPKSNEYTQRRHHHDRQWRRDTRPQQRTHNRGGKCASRKHRKK